MRQNVVFKFEGNLEQQGFKVMLEIGIDNQRPHFEKFGSLPANSTLVRAIREHWQDKYRNAGAPYTHQRRASALLDRPSILQQFKFRIKPKKAIYDGHIKRLEECKQSAKNLECQFREWLSSPEFYQLELCLREELDKSEDIEIALRTNDRNLQKLPWHLWEFYQRYPRAEISFSPLVAGRSQIGQRSLHPNVKILAILGHQQGIDVNRDRQFLEDLPNAEVTFLPEPKRQEINDKLWEQAWDIIFFAGHSETEGETGKIYINPEESLELKDLWYGLRKAVDRGLKLAIFNSCDGLGLAQKIDDWQIPIAIVMRELVPDRVAQEFLKYFLDRFVRGVPFHLAVREAREQLQGLEGEFPCASWLPTICKNPIEVLPNWTDWLSPESDLELKEEEATESLRVEPTPRRKPHFRKPLQTLALVSILATSVVMGLRSIGWLEPLELHAYDRLMQLRPAELPDDRMLIVTITEEDIQAQPPQELRGASISDRNLDKLLQILDELGAQTIGLELIRDFPVDLEYPQHQQLRDRLQNMPNLFFTCYAGNDNLDRTTTLPPPELQNLERVGFNNIIRDDEGRVLRRQILSMTNRKENCPTSRSFSFQLATEYLNTLEIETKVNSYEEYQIGQKVIKPLPQFGGVYRNLGSPDYQIMLNYRQYSAVARTISLQQILNRDIDTEWVKNKIVLIGATASSSAKTYPTPIKFQRFGRFHEEMPALFIHAHATSQIVSSVLNDRPSIQTLPNSIELISIWSFALFGSFLSIWTLRKNNYIFLAWSIFLASVFLATVSLTLLVSGWWIPLVPAELAFVFSIAIVFYLKLESQNRSV
ncbi:CHASE2 domain-containing protein [Baaleninema simplex]|uniref:CHASE2 domain-containing protein n=1 Tax=Baaleninema simplex TaxID=2862350 RepID=UPI000379F256|nr:CHASE2 domain-containing protein [Baaleninema simplex]